MPAQYTFSVSRRALWFVVVLVGFAAVWHERGTIGDILQQAVEKDAALDAQDARHDALRGAPAT